MDRFKLVNSALGHDQGDEILREVVARIGSCREMRPPVLRVAGDEFLMIVHGLPATRAGAMNRARVIAQEILERVRRPYSLAKGLISLSASAGVVVFDGEEIPPASFVRQAEMALYYAKSGGGNRVQVFHPPMETAVSRRLAVEKGLHHGLENGELAVAFQPQVDNDGRIIGAEALVRWHHREHGAIEPDEFIPAAEDMGLVGQVSDLVLNESCTWLEEQGGAFAAYLDRVSLNVSVRQLESRGYPARLGRILDVHGMDPERLTLEITESALATRFDRIRDTISELRMLGCRIAIDDFGTGYSTLARLRDLPADELKIDRFFVRDIECSGRRRIVQSIVEMAHDMNLVVVAEGVETRNQHAVLQSIGCDRYQGFLFGRPMPAGAFNQWLSRTVHDRRDESADGHDPGAPGEAGLGGTHAVQ